MVPISEKVILAAESIHKELTSALAQMAAHVELVEKTHGPVSSDHGVQMIEMSSVCQNLTIELHKYTLFFGEIADVVTHMDDEVDQLGARFKERSLSPGIPATTAQAMEHFHRSRSTIYRWIKNGRLPAEKRGYRWTVFI
jgi:hypothetical protein